MMYPSYDKLRVLIVDDFDNFRISVNRMLQSMGVQNIELAMNGNQAVLHCKRRQFDLILCDFNLGMGKNGLQVLEQLRSENLLAHAGLFALVTAETSRSTVLAVNEYNPDAFLMKPITGRALQTRVDRLLLRRESVLPALLALDAEQPDSAIAYLQEQVTAEGRYFVDAQKLLGQLYLDQGSYDLAAILYRSVLEVREVDWAQVGLAKALQEDGQWSDARNILNDTLKENSLCMEAYSALAKDCRHRKDSHGLQKILKDAVKVSPLSRNLQKSLAEVAVTNNDLSAASQAYRKTIRLGHNSCHENAEDHLEYGRATVGLMEGDDAGSSRDLLRDVLADMGTLEKKFSLSADQFLQTQLICCQAYKGQGNDSKAKEVFKDIEARQNGTRSDFDTELDKVHTLLALGEKRLADEALEELIRLYENDQEALQKLDPLLDEPISELNKERVKSINREGIDFYKGKKYEEAIECFTQAKQLFPNHIGIHLNLVQALSGHINSFGYNTERMALCMSALRHVESKLTPASSQFKRYRSLRESCQSIESNSRNNR